MLVSDRPQPVHEPGDGRTWRGPQVCSLTGVTYRQLDYWARTELVQPSIAGARGSGTQRLYSTRDVVVVAALRHLAQLGAHRSMRAAGETLSELPTERWPAFLLVGDGGTVELSNGNGTGSLVSGAFVHLPSVVGAVLDRMSELLPLSA